MPDPSAPQPAASASTLATPSITPGHDAAAVAAKDLPLAAGGSLVAGDPVTIASRLEEAPGWTVVRSAMQGGGPVPEFEWLRGFAQAQHQPGATGGSWG
ncbi:hypothetical protein AAHB33_13315 [Paenarthrobacter sp. S56]|uniref:hypothetical protein n=1 Tax=Paenarthrobacter sp. S56 TaxID=3138179 RepID=UPI00321BBC69